MPRANKTIFNDPEKRRRTREKTAQYFQQDPDSWAYKLRTAIMGDDSSDRKKLAEKMTRRKGVAQAAE